MAVSVIDESGLTAVDSFFEDVLATDGLKAAPCCNVCGSALGWRLMNPGHFCRFCRNTVCTTCSSSDIYLEGHKRPQRACDMCVKIIPRAHWVKRMLTAIVSHCKGGSKSQGIGVASAFFQQSELGLTQQGNACMLSNVLFVMAASMTQDAESAIPDGLFDEGKSMCRFQEAWNCGICTKALGWHKMRPRHHCRFCGISVCANCSMSNVYLKSQKMPFRACNTCAKIIPAAHKVKNRLTDIAGNLQAVGRSFSSGEPLEVIDEGRKSSHVDIIRSGFTQVDSILDDASIAKEHLVFWTAFADQSEKKVAQEEDASVDAVTFSADMYDVF